jgi:hypothetical protein
LEVSVTTASPREVVPPADSWNEMPKRRANIQNQGRTKEIMLVVPFIG